MSKPLPEEVFEKIREAYDRDMSLSKAGEYAGVGRTAVGKYWKSWGLKAHGLSVEERKISEEQEKKIMEAYDLDMTLREAGKYAGISEGTVGKYWKSWGLKAHGLNPEERKISEEVQKKIREAYDLGMSLSKAGEYAGVCQLTVGNYWKSWGLKAHGLNPEERKFSEEVQEKIREAYDLGMSLSKAGEYAGVGHASVGRYWKSWGLEARLNSQKIRTVEQLIEILDTEPKARYAMQLARGNESAVADILAVVYDGQVPREELVRFLHDPSLGPYLGEYRKPLSSVLDLAEPIEGLLRLDKNGEIAEIVKRSLIDYRREALGAKPDDEKVLKFILELDELNKRLMRDE